MEKEIKTMHQVVYQFHKKNPHIEYNEILSEANIIFIKAIDTYNPMRERTLCSWIAFLMHRELRKQFKDLLPCVEYNDSLQNNNTYNPERIYIFKETLNNLSTASKIIIKIIFEKNISTKKEIKKELRSQGFAWNKIQMAFCELKGVAKAIT